MMAKALALHHSSCVAFILVLACVPNCANLIPTCSAEFSWHSLVGAGICRSYLNSCLPSISSYTGIAVLIVQLLLCPSNSPPAFWLYVHALCPLQPQILRQLLRARSTRANHSVLNLNTSPSLPAATKHAQQCSHERPAVKWHASSGGGMLMHKH